jgi:centromere protein X
MPTKAKPRTSRFAPPARRHNESDEDVDEDEQMMDDNDDPEAIDLDSGDFENEYSPRAKETSGRKNKKDKAPSSRRARNVEEEEPEPEPEEQGDNGDEEPTAKIPQDLLTRILHEFFAREDTRISKGANRALGKYFEVFVGEAIARTAEERPEGSFLEVCFWSLSILHFRVLPTADFWRAKTLILGVSRLRIWRRLRHNC